METIVLGAGIVDLYITLVIALFIGPLFLKHGWISNRGDAHAVGAVCGCLWPFLPLILAGFITVKPILRRFSC